MTKIFTLPATRALPYVNGESRRFKADPTKLTPLAGKVMMASGALSTRRRDAVSFPMGRIVGAMALVAAMAAVFLGGSPNNGQTQVAAAPGVETQTLVAGIVDRREPAAAERQPEMRAETPALSELTPAAGVVEGQDRFEIDRFFRLDAAARRQRTIE